MKEELEKILLGHLVINNKKGIPFCIDSLIRYIDKHVKSMPTVTEATGGVILQPE